MPGTGKQDPSLTTMESEEPLAACVCFPVVQNLNDNNQSKNCLFKQLTLIPI
jgi:hypothetical protein